jgi:hypothetical protein
MKRQADTMHAIPTAANVEATPADTLRGAALYLQRHGWTRFSYFDGQRPTPPACAQGAIVVATYGVATEHPYSQDFPQRRLLARTIDFFDDYIRGVATALDDEDCPATVWNDLPCRSATEVIAALRDAADRWEAGHASGGGP